MVHRRRRPSAGAWWQHGSCSRARSTPHSEQHATTRKRSQSGRRPGFSTRLARQWQQLTMRCRIVDVARASCPPSMRAVKGCNPTLSTRTSSLPSRNTARRHEPLAPSACGHAPPAPGSSRALWPPAQPIPHHTPHRNCQRPAPLTRMDSPINSVQAVWRCWGGMALLAFSLDWATHAAAADKSMRSSNDRENENKRR